MSTFRIPSFNAEKLAVQLEQLNKKARKCGAPEVVSRFVSFSREKVADYGMVTFYEFEITGASPALPGGWVFQGTIEHHGTGNLVRALPGVALPEVFREQASTCDHCGKVRSRVETFVVKNEAGELKRVGRQCVRDFLGHQSPARLAYLAELFNSLEDLQQLGGEYGARDYRLPLLQVMEMAVEVSKQKGGFVSKKAAQAYAEASGGATRPTTSELTYLYLFPTLEMIRDGDTIDPTPESITLAAQIVEYAQQLAGGSDYEHNLRTVALMPLIDQRKHIGIAVSAIGAWERFQHKLLVERKRLDGWKTSDYFGVTSKRGDYTLTLEKIINLGESMYGERCLYTFRDEIGNRAVWFTAPQYAMEPGTTYKVRATVKKHELYKGEVKQTVLTRCKVTDLIQSEQKAKGAA